MADAGRAGRMAGTLVALVAVVALAATLRFYHLGSESVWLDEAISVQIASDPPRDIVLDAVQDVHPPLYYLLLHAWTAVTGLSERAVRSLSVAVSLLAVLAVAAFAARWFEGTTAALAALLTAISPLQIAFAQEGRMYALLSLTAVLSLDAFLWVLRRGHARSLVSFALATGAMLYTHGYGEFVVAAEALWLVGAGLFSRSRRRIWWRRGSLALGLAALVYVPWLPSLFYQLMTVEHGFWITRRATVVEAVIAQAGSPALAWLLGLSAIVALVVVAVQANHERADVDWNGAAVTLCATTVVAVIGLPFLLSRVSEPIFLPKYTIACSLAFIVLAARGVTLVPWRIVRAGIVVATVALTAGALHVYFATVHKDDWRDLVAALERAAQPGDLVVLSQSFGMSPFDYYARRTDLVELPFADLVGGLTKRSLGSLASAAVAPYDRVWVVVSDPDVSTAALVGALTGYDTAAEIDPARGSEGIEARLYVRHDTPRKAP